MEEIQKQQDLVKELEGKLKEAKLNLRNQLEQYVLDNIKTQFQEKIKFEREDAEENVKIGLLLPNPYNDLEILAEEVDFIKRIVEMFEKDDKYEVLFDAIKENWTATVRFHDKEDRSDATEWEYEPREMDYVGEYDSKSRQTKSDNGFLEFPGFEKNKDDSIPEFYCYFTPDELGQNILSNDEDYKRYISKNLSQPNIKDDKVDWGDWDDAAKFVGETYHSPVLIMLK